MTGEERRQDIFHTIETSDSPISGTALANKYSVSRQVIVQDIALLRAVHKEIYSTPRGYILMPSSNRPKEKTPTASLLPQRVFQVTHTDEQIEDELNTIVDNGGKVLDVFIKHEVYGFLRAELPIHCRRHVQEFMADLQNGKSRPLKNLSSGSIHFHTVEADSEQTLDLVEKELLNKGYLIK